LSKRFLSILIFLTFFIKGFSQLAQVPDSLQKHFQKSYFITHATIGGVVLGGLYNIWYADYSGSKFHFFNDNNEWMKLDKFGHAYSNFHITSLLAQQYYYAGFNKRKASLIGWGISNLYFLGIETMDGFSEGWGFSCGDMLANLTGSTLAMLEYRWWQEQKFNLKFMYAPSPYPKYRPDLLGNNFPSKLIKDYNAQSYWLCVSPWSFYNTNHWLSCIQIAMGYGANGMIAATQKKQETIGFGNTKRYQQFFFSLDVDWTKLPIKNPKIKNWLRYLNVVKIPLPYISIANNKASYNWYPKY